VPKPSFIVLSTLYHEKFGEDDDRRQPCEQGRAADPPWNQCAIRMSIVLNAEGNLRVDKGTYTEPKCKHGHARGAESLANWLWKKLGPPRIWTKGAEAKRALMSKSGIIFFKDCFTRANETTARGDHIDLWERGSCITFGDPANNAKQVWFFELK
jgi:hypothetical protein